MEYVTTMKPGLLTTVQDLGRPEYKKYGVAVSGAMDTFSMRVGNILAGNDESSAVLEVTLIGPTLKFSANTFFVITGGDLSPQLNGQDIPLWTVLQAKPEDILSFGKCKTGCRAYIAFSGGINVPKVMNSRSTFLRGEYGGFDGRALKRGDQIKLGEVRFDAEKIKRRKLRLIDTPDFITDRAMKFIEGPHIEEFEEDTIEDFFALEYTLSNASDRMGYRLEGPVLKHKEKADIISDFITKGTIQVPGNGQPIIHMADCGTSGGYTKIGVIISVDLSELAQKKPGDKLKFERISVEEAQERKNKEEKLLSELKINNKMI